MKQCYSVTLKVVTHHSFEVYAESEAEAWRLAIARADEGDWGRECSSSVAVHEVEEL